jgi:predicted dehydrogenase
MDFIRHDRKRECVVFGSKGTIRWNGLTGCVEFFKIKTKVWKELFNSEDLEQSYEKEWDNLIMSYLKKYQPIVNGAEGIRTLNVISAIKKSSKLDGIKIKII